MSMEREFKIVLSVNSDSLASQIAQRVKGAWEDLPIRMEITPDPGRVVASLKDHGADLLICEAERPGTSLQQFLRDSRGAYAGVLFLVLGKMGSNIKETGVTEQKLPITNWTDFLAKIHESVPEELKIKYNLLSRNNVLFLKLTEYGKRYQESPTLKSVKQNIPEALLVIPTSFDQKSNDVASNMHKESITEQSVNTKVEFREWSVAEQKRITMLEVYILILVITVCGAVYWAFKDDEGIFSLKNVAVFLGLFAVGGFFLGKAFDRFIFSRNDK